ncbi:hypothetical protein BDW02DRAFT_574417 [Decorospora gaudefroyi]|uniref:Uncharacterized protein n=1 Tax=Decorospora gaudefroyi TaxID=184978 RepID=A0A6A5K3V9_9PLEO|nr:hypothetical protein BDW02DRAFT_574417 [Decorospora gaudefroyi]
MISILVARGCLAQTCRYSYLLRPVCTYKYPDKSPTTQHGGFHHTPSLLSSSTRYLTYSYTALDAMDQMKKAFKGLFKSKKSKKAEPKPTASSETAAPAKPTESQTAPAAPAPAPAPEPVQAEVTPAMASVAPAQPASGSAPAPPQDKANKDEAAALAEVKRATQGRLTSRSHSHPQQYREGEAWNGARHRQKVARDNEWGGPI